MGLAARKVLSRCSDAQIERLIEMGREDRILGMIRKYADFDWHRKVITVLSKSQVLMSRLSSLY